MIKNTLLVAGIISLFSLSSCKTYYIPLESFKEQFKGMETAPLRTVKVKDPWGFIESYQVYPIDYIKAVDKSGNPVTLKTKPSLEVRITDTTNRKRIFYFDLMRIEGEYVKGGQSRIVSAIRAKVAINAIKKIEIQDGGKKYSYVK